MKIIYSGLESSGKSLALAMLAPQIIKRNAQWHTKTGITRPLVSNLKFSEPFENWAIGMGIPINYCENLDDLIKVRNADVFIDEVGNYFDSRLWADLSLDARRWLSQGAKSGIELYGTAQDFAQVDKAFRRLVNHLYHITKVCGSRRPAATRPLPKFIWGLCLKRELDPQGYDEDKKKFASGGLIPWGFFIRKEYCEIFDTTQFIQRSKPLPYKHIERECEIPGCPHLSHNKKIQHI